MSLARRLFPPSSSYADPGSANSDSAKQPSATQPRAKFNRGAERARTDERTKTQPTVLGPPVAKPGYPIADPVRRRNSSPLLIKSPHKKSGLLLKAPPATAHASPTALAENCRLLPETLVPSLSLSLLVARCGPLPSSSSLTRSLIRFAFRVGKQHQGAPASPPVHVPKALQTIPVRAISATTGGVLSTHVLLVPLSVLIPHTLPKVPYLLVFLTSQAHCDP